MSETWLPFAVKTPGPKAKQGYGQLQQRVYEGIVGHSMEGSLVAALGELMNPNRQASWTISNPKAGPLLQHYPLEAVTWASGSVEANRRFIGIESEGVAGELLNPNQIKNMQDLMNALPIPAWKRGETIFEHREMVQFGASPTACPSNRYPWAQIIGGLEGDMAALTPDEQQELLAKVRFLHLIFMDDFDGAGPESAPRWAYWQTLLQKGSTPGAAADAKAIADELAGRLKE